jgi:hypothetical protein
VNTGVMCARSQPLSTVVQALSSNLSQGECQMSSFGCASCSRPSHRHRSWPLVRLVTCVLACAVVAGATPSAVAEIVYTMTDAPTIQNGWTLSGTITVAGVGTGLSSTDITSWMYTVTDGSSSYTYSSSDGGGLNTAGLLATSTELIVPYWQQGNPRSYLQLNAPVAGGGALLEWSTGNDEDNPRYYSGSYPLGFWGEYSPAYPLTTTDGWVIGTVAGVPEIDPATGMSAVSIVAGVLAMIDSRRRKGLSGGGGHP